MPVALTDEVIGRQIAATERKVLARQLFERGRNGMRRAMAIAPDVVFVSALGNSDDDSGFTEDAPSSF